MPQPKHTAPKVQTASDQLDLRPGQSLELLKELHILTREGKINQDSRRKLKQVNHLYQFIEKILKELPASDAGPTLADQYLRHRNPQRVGGRVCRAGAAPRF